MYRKDSEGWLKHTDFIILDMICLQLAYVLAYAISGYGFNPYETIIYRNMAVFLELADLVMIFAYGTMKSVLKRGYYRDFVVTLNHAIMVGALAVLYLFLLQEGQDFSRLTLMLTICASSRASGCTASWSWTSCWKTWGSKPRLNFICQICHFLLTS